MLNRNIFKIVAVLLVQSFFVLGSSKLLAQSFDCSDPRSYLTIEEAQFAASTRVTNISLNCTTSVGAAVYRMFDASIASQVIFDLDLATLSPGQTVLFTPDLPDCAYQYDIFYGDPILDLSTGETYGVRLFIGDQNVVDQNYCTVNPTPIPTPTPTITPTPQGPPLTCAASSPNGLDIPCSGNRVSASASVTANRAVTVQWSSNCTSAALTILSATSVGVEFSSRTTLGTSESCVVRAAVTASDGSSSSCETPISVGLCRTDCAGTIAGSAILDECGVCNGNGSQCLGCTSTDFSQTLIALDSGALGLRNIGIRASTLGKFSRRNRASQMARLSRLYAAAWKDTYTLPAVNVSCENNVRCDSISLDSPRQAYLTSIVRLSSEVSRIIGKAKRSVSKNALRKLNTLERRALLAKQSSMKSLDSTPSSIFTCEL